MTLLHSPFSILRLHDRFVVVVSSASEVSFLTTTMASDSRQDMSRDVVLDLVLVLVLVSGVLYDMPFHQLEPATPSINNWMKSESEIADETSLSTDILSALFIDRRDLGHSVSTDFN